jgi:hypothetical protein
MTIDDIYRATRERGLVPSKRQFSQEFLGRAPNYIADRGFSRCSTGALLNLPPRCLEWVACVSLPCPGSQRHPLQGCFFVRLKRAVSSSRPDDAQGGARRRGQGWPLGHRALGAALGVLDGGEHGARLGQDGRLGMDDHA